MANEAQQTHPLVKAWYEGSAWLYLLWPASVFYRLIMALRSTAYRFGLFKTYQASMPVIVVGNISVGGTGKTPMVIKLVKSLKDNGLKPAVISRGYGSKAPAYPYAVSPTDAASIAGDEPLLIAQSVDCPVIIGANRQQSIELLTSDYDCDVVVTDDGLQHYALERDIEIAIIDGERLFGNGHCLPMGPLREPINRLSQVDWAVFNNNANSNDKNINMQLVPDELIQLCSNKACSTQEWTHPKQVHAIAGIGNPGRFFHTLRELGFEPIEHAFTDHHHYTPSDIHFDDDLPILMTSKDAVKIHAFANDKCWHLPVTANITPNFIPELIARVKDLQALKATQQSNRE